MTSTLTGPSITVVTTSSGTAPITYPGPRALRAATRTLLDAMTVAGLGDPRWATAGPLVSAAALRLRKALGAASHGSCVGTAPVVRERDFAVAARGLLRDDVHLTDLAAARDFVRLALDAARALS